MKLIPTVLAGGSGTRLWPLSRALYPKQFLSLTGQGAMLQETLQRLRGSFAPPELSAPIIVTGESSRFLTAEQLRLAGITPESIILEPCPRGTAPALTLAALHALADQEDALLLVLPADHHIAKPEEFRRAISAAVAPAAQGRLITFGITPTSPETGYGYIERGEILPEGSAEFPAYQLRRFVEKPDADAAGAMLAQGGYYWNSGMFLFSAQAWCAELKNHNPQMFEACVQAMAGAAVDYDFLRPMAESFAASPANSIDYAVMEHTDKGLVLPLECGWSDLGSWQALWQISPKDSADNVCLGEVFTHEVTGSYLRGEGRVIAALGVKNLVVVETPDAVLVADRARAQDIKILVDKMAAGPLTVTEVGTRDYRPWGDFETVNEGERFKVKRITVKPGGKLSLQRHHHRAEHWVVVKGLAKVECNGEAKFLSEDQSIYIPIGSAHRLENPGRIPLELIEVQTGGYLGEDDIVRLDDEYGR